MPIDRAETVRNAEKLVRKGRLEQAIVEYLRVAEEQPGDWNIANALGDLYIRAGRTASAVEQFTRSADILTREGFLQKAGALYKKVLKIQPDHEHALLKSGDVAARQGLLVDARGYLNAVGERRRGDVLGLASTTVRLGALDPKDNAARLAAARARVVLDDVAGAVRDLKALAAEFVDANQADDAIATLNEAAQLAPGDIEVIDLRAALFASRGVHQSSDAAYEPVTDVADAVLVPQGLAAADAPAVPEEWLETTAVLEPIRDVEPHAVMPAENAASVVPDEITLAHPPTPAPVRDIEAVFAEMREDATRRFAIDESERDFQRGLMLCRAGEAEEAMAALENASRAPRFRHQAGSAIAGIFRERGQTWQAIEWLERAAEAPAPTPEDGYHLLLQLGDLLESVGEIARALAICLELRAEAGDYKDVAERVDRLAKVLARG